MALSQQTDEAIRTALAQSTMTRNETESVMAKYLDALLTGGDFARYFSDEITMTLADAHQQIRGKDAVRNVVVNVHQVAFDARVRIDTLVIGSGVASAEAIFAGVHTAEFAGIPATGREVHVPYAVFWRLEGGAIISLTVYGLMTGLIQQLTADPQAGEAR